MCEDEGTRLPLRPCSNPTCGALVVRGKCEACKGKRASATRRGYGYKWRLFREEFLLELAVSQGRPEAECEDCREQAAKMLEPRLRRFAKVNKATDVHHVKKVRDYPHLQFVKSNCRGLCGECHKIRTGRGE